jgi:hypothetical protein
MGIANLNSATKNISNPQKMVFTVTTHNEKEPRTGPGKDFNMALRNSLEEVNGFHSCRADGNPIQLVFQNSKWSSCQGFNP